MTWNCSIAGCAWSYMRVDPFEIIKILTNDSSRYQCISETHPIKKRFEMDTIEWHPNLYYICITLILPSFGNQYLNNSFSGSTHYVPKLPLKIRARFAFSINLNLMWSSREWFCGCCVVMYLQLLQLHQSAFYVNTAERSVISRLHSPRDANYQIIASFVQSKSFQVLW